MSENICTVNPTPVVVVASHEELLRSARDLWAVAVSLITELTPDKFTTAPWAAGLFSLELPFILGKLWHLQQGVLTAAHSYMETESMLTTVLESIDVSKLIKQLGEWAVELKPELELPRGLSQHVPPVTIMQPSDVNIIKQRFDENTWSNQPLIRHESFQLANQNTQHWFYLPKQHDWSVINGEVNVDSIDPRLADFIKTKTLASDEIVFVAEQDGELIVPDVQTAELEGSVAVYKLETIEGASL